ncbi:MAG: tRNA (adenosine(37)-N6)-dimethylallyltransferase MiaA, partial [Candidatus Omnitrophica bacterium]|nr:tRNA (adenosine(37)-N6)-dimethylallyltransferase MiaA [Candidatus Omnitrophota bacterium]
MKHPVRSLSHSPKRKKVLFLIGPTAVGKSEVAVELAKKIGAEIISCDSMQVYKGMDILSSMPSKDLTHTVKHHLINIVNPSKEYDVYQYYKSALRKVKEIIKKRRIPLFVGGSGLYINILLNGIFKLKGSSKRIRDLLYLEAKNKGLHYLYERLKKIDPQVSSKIHPHDLRRIVRALEVYEISRIPISQLHKQRKGLFNLYEIKIFGLWMQKNLLYERIKDRLENMFNKGLIQEVKRLLGKNLSKTASSAIGIQEIKGYLEGKYDLDTAKSLIEKRTRLLV